MTPTDRTLGVDASLILDTAHEAFVAMDPDGLIVEWNRAADELFGWQREEIVGRELASVLIPERLRDAHRRGLARFLETGEGPVLETRIELPALRRDGSEVEVEITISAVTAGTGRFFHAFLHDISQRASRQRLAAAQLEVVETLATADPDDAVRSLLRVLCRIGGWSYAGIWNAGDDAEMLHGYCAWWDPAIDLARFESASRSAGFYRGRGLPGIVWENGEPIWHWPTAGSKDFPRYVVAHAAGLRSGAAIPLRAGREIVAILELFDVEDHEPDEEQRALLQATAWQIGEYLGRRRAERSAAAEKDAFVAMVSHELRTPLTAISGFAQTMIEHDDRFDSAKRRDFLEIILTQGQRLGRLVDDLLSMERLHVGGIVPKIERVGLSDATREVLLELDLQDRFRVHVRADCTHVLADRDLCKQIVVNFVQNALRYGEPPFEIEIAAAADGFVRLGVADHGPGVPAEFEPRLFERFARATVVADTPGTGLGLAIVKGLAETQNGRVFHERVEPHGARFVLELPRAADSVRELPA